MLSQKIEHERSSRVDAKMSSVARRFLAYVAKGHQLFRRIDLLHAGCALREKRDQIEKPRVLSKCDIGGLRSQRMQATITRDQVFAWHDVPLFCVFSLFQGTSIAADSTKCAPFFQVLEQHSHEPSQTALVF